MERMEILENGKVTFTYINKNDEKEVNAEPGDHEGLVEIGRDIEGVEVSIFIRQREENEDVYKKMCIRDRYNRKGSIIILNKIIKIK